MALHQDTIWEVRTGGSNENGGGFHDRIPGTSVDYSFQNAPQLALVDLVGSAASVTVTSVAGGFTAAMVGNVMRIRAGANFTVGFYEIVAINSANSVDLDRIPCTAAGANGLTKIGGGQINCDLIDTIVVPGNTVYIASGAYAAHPGVTFNAAYTPQLPLVIWGYDVARNTRPAGNNRPSIQMGANQFAIRNSVKVRNIRFSGTADGVLAIQNPASLQVQLIENCKIENLAVAGVVRCVSQGSAPAQPSSAIFIDCEFSGTAGATSTGAGIDVGQPIFILNCHFHDLSYGLALPGSNQSNLQVYFSIFAKISLIAIQISTNNTHCSRIVNCTFNTIGVDGFFSNYAPLSGLTFINNTFSDCVNSGINAPASVVMNNNFFSCGTPWIGGTLDPVDNNTFIAPQFVTPGSNYALQRTSGLIDRAFSMRLGV